MLNQPLNQGLSAPSAYQGNLMAGLAAEDDLQDHALALQARSFK